MSCNFDRRFWALSDTWRVGTIFWFLKSLKDEFEVIACFSAPNAYSNGITQHHRSMNLAILERLYKFVGNFLFTAEKWQNDFGSFLATAQLHTRNIVIKTVRGKTATNNGHSRGDFRTNKMYFLNVSKVTEKTARYELLRRRCVYDKFITPSKKIHFDGIIWVGFSASQRPATI